MVHIADTAPFNASPAALWQALFTPSVLAEIIPGCHELTQTGPVDYAGEIVLGIAAVAGRYTVDVHVDEAQEPTFTRLSGTVAGPTGTITGKASITLEEVSGEQTNLSYEGQATVSGALGHMSPRFIESVATTLIKQGLHRLDKRLASEQTRTP
jgi:carbon monoxide dehydrogenase subunit G